MKALLSIALVTAAGLYACGKADLAKSVKAVDGEDGESCTVAGNVLTCADGTSYKLSSSEAQNWTLVQNTDGSVTIKRPGEPDVTIGAKGDKGDKGDPGQSGRNGADACTPKFWLDSGRCLWVQCGSHTEKLGAL